ncbi:hypothetical protein C8R44DRAFT_764023 [Mycena epipterygia]|nr:hypothetical protein C8R44DRAFT_764023 [Mycena epipterygia]
MADALPIKIDNALHHAEHASAAARECADAVADLRRAIEVLREEKELLQTDLISALKRQRAYESRVEELEVALEEERARMRDAEKALREEREFVTRNLAEAAESMEEMGRQQWRRTAQGLSGSSTHVTPTPNLRAVEDTASDASRRVLRPRGGTGAPNFKSRAVDPPSDTSSSTRALKRRRLSSPTSPEPEPPRSLRDLERDILAFSQRTSPELYSRNLLHDDVGEFQALSEELLRHAEAL